MSSRVSIRPLAYDFEPCTSVGFPFFADYAYEHGIYNGVGYKLVGKVCSMRSAEAFQDFVLETQVLVFASGI
jgi:hypothetical protein